MLRFSRNNKREARFGKPDFQEKLARARQYQRKSNPVQSNWGGFFRGFSRISKFFLFFGLLLVLAVLYFLTLSNTFLVRQVALIDGAGSSADEINAVLAKLEDQRYYLTPRNHIVFLNKQDFQKSVQADQPQIKEITSFKRIFPNKLEFSIVRREPKYVWQSGDKYFLLDQEGIVFQELFNYDQAVYSETAVNDQTGFKVNFGEDLGVGETLEFIEKIKNHWVRLVPQTSYVGFAVPGRKSPDVFVRTGFGFQVYFDRERSATAQLENLNLVLSQEIDQTTYSGLSYVDLRLSNMAYYCYRDAPCAPEYSTSTILEL